MIGDGVVETGDDHLGRHVKRDFRVLQDAQQLAVARVGEILHRHQRQDAAGRLRGDGAAAPGDDPRSRSVVAVAGGAAREERGAVLRTALRRSSRKTLLSGSCSLRAMIPA